MLGAYGSAMRTAFNGFGSDQTVIVTDEPMASLYLDEPERVASNVVTL
jgi:ornithine decarboxylase